MKRATRLTRVLVAFGLALVAVIMIGCNLVTLTPGPSPLPSVEAVPLPKLPNWIESISPTGDTVTQAQIRIRFQEPLIPVERLDSEQQNELLQKFEVVPPLPGRFRFLTPRMVGFQADQAIPLATRVKVTLKAGLQDLKNHRLTQDLAWTFSTEPIRLTELPTSYPSKETVEPIDIKPTLSVTSNTELDLASLRELGRLTPDSSTQTIPLKIALKESPQPDTTPPTEAFDSSERTWMYTLEPQQPLQKATRYTLEFAPGLRPLKGNLLTEQAITSRVETYSPLAFQTVTSFGKPDAGGAFGRFENGSPQLEFNNGLDLESAIAQISIQPEPKTKDIPLVRAYEGERVATLNPWALEPNTQYTIAIAADLKDQYGQTLGKPVTATYQTGDIVPEIWAPADLHIFPTTRDDLNLNISTVNLARFKSAFQVVQPTDLVYTNTAYPRGEGTDLLPPPARWATTSVKSQKNQTTETALPLQKQFGGKTGLLAYGVQARTNRYQDNNQTLWREPSFYGLVQVTNLGVFAQWFPDSGLVRVNHLADGSAVANAAVQVYVSQLEAKERSQPTPCATGTTNKVGLLQLDRAAVQACLPTKQDNPPALLVIAREGADWAFTRTYEYSGAYEYGLEAGWDSGKPISRGTIFSDRQLYQPGETATLTGIAYYLQNGVLKQDANARYSLTLSDPNGRKTDLGSRTTNAFGTLSLEVPLSPTQPLGFYRVEATGDSGAQISGELRVAEFKPPNFKVALSLDSTDTAQGVVQGGGRDRTVARSSSSQTLALAQTKQVLKAKIDSQYLFGAPVERGRADYYVTRQQADFAPQGWDGFQFGRQWYWPEEPPEVESDVLQTQQILDAKGQGQTEIKLGDDLPYPMLYRVDAQVSDVSNLSVADSKTVLVLPSERLIGLKTDFVAEAGQAFPVEIVVTDAKGQAIAGESVRLELQHMIYSRMTRVVEGSRTSQNQVEYKTVAQQDVRSQSSPQSVTLTPTESGAYRIRALFPNRSEASATDQQIWVTGGATAMWGDRYRNNRLEVRLDKPVYKPGDTATVLIQSPYPEADLYFAVVRHGVLYQTLTQVTGAAPEIQFQVTPEMLPNAAVEAVLVRRGQPLSPTEPSEAEVLSRIGFAPFQTDLSDRYLNLELAPTTGREGQPPAAPGAAQTLQLTLKDAQAKPVQGQVTVMVVNEAILQLTGYRPPDLVTTVYAEQPISTRLSDNRPDVVLSPLSSPLEKGWGYGGGFSAGASNTRLRTDFKPLAYYNATVLTDANGQAQVTFTLPDDLTTWHVLAVATAQATPAAANWRFGQADTTFMTSQPVVASPVLPQFARPGDQFDIGIALTNNTGSPGQAAVRGQVAAPLRFNQSDGKQQAQQETGTRAYRFPVTVERAGTAQVQFAAELNGATDGFQLPLDVKPLQVTEQVVETGTTTREVKIPLKVDNNVANDTGGLEISLASTLIPQLTAPAEQVLDTQDLPFLEPVASQLAIAASLQTLSQTYQQTFKGFRPTQQANQAAVRLRQLQRPDGGFAAYPGQTQADPFLTPYAARALALADRTFGNSAASQLIPSVQTYLKQLLANPGRYPFCKAALCQAQVRLETLMALADLGDRRNEFLADIYAQRNQLDLVQQIKLARYLAQFPDWQAQARAMSQQIQERIAQSGRSAQIKLPQGWGWLDSTATAQAQAVRLAIAQSATPEQVGRLVKGLLDQRREGTWQTTYDNAEALTALVIYSQQQPTPPNFTATAQLAGKSLMQAKFQGYRNSSQAVTIPMAELPRNQHELVLRKSGSGTLHYLAAYRYRLAGHPSGRLNGLRVTRTIRPANQDKELYRTGLYATTEMKLPVGQVFDVGLEVITDHPVDHVVITDPLPAGFEAVDNSFQTSTPYFQAQGDSWQLTYQTIHRDRIVAFGDRLEPGVYTLHYLVRSVTPGRFVYPGAEAHLQYEPEEFGRTAGTTLVLEESS